MENSNGHQTGLSAPRFAPGDFVHNARIAASIVPAMAVMVGFGGTMVAGVCMIGAVAAYLLDALRQREGSLAAVWITLAATNLFLISSSSIDQGSRSLLLCLLALGVCSTLLFVIGCWATLQFRWVQMQYPPVVLALERMVLAGGISVGGPMMAWGAIAAVGASSAPYYTAFVLSALYLLLVAPTPSSFQRKEIGRGGGSRNPVDFAAQGRLESACGAALTVYLPGSMYTAIHWQVLFDQTEHIWGLLLLISAPLLVVSSAPGGLWWLPMKKNLSDALRWTVAMVSLAALVAGLEGSVIFAAFREYILLHPPWNWILVTAAIFGHGAVVLLHFSGALKNTVVYAITSVALMLSCTAACFSVGLPLSIVPAPLISALGMVLFYRTHSQREFSLFLLGMGLTGVWFIRHHFWFLDIPWGGYWDVQSACLALCLYAGPTVLLPGLLISRAPTWLSSSFLVFHAVLLCVMEVILYSGNDSIGDMYPAYAVLCTSLGGFVVAGHLTGSDNVYDSSVWTARLVYAAKATMLLLPQPKQTLNAVMLASAAMAPILLHPQKPGAVRKKRIKPGLVLLYVLAILVASWEARHTLFTALSGSFGTRIGEGFALGAFLVMISFALYPMIRTHFSSSVLAKQALLMLLTAGVMMLGLRPPLPVSATCHPHHKHHKHARWLCLHLYSNADGVVHEVDDVAIYGLGIGRREHWAIWLLLVALLAGLAAFGQQRNFRTHGTVGHVVFGIISGAAVGGYMAFEFFPHQHVLQILLLISCLLVACAVVFVGLPTSGAPVYLPPILWAWAALLPAALTLEESQTLPDLDHVRLHPDATVSVEDERKTFRFISLVMIYAVQSALLAFCFKLKISRGADSQLTRQGSGRSRRLRAEGAASIGSPKYGGPGAASLGSFLGSCLPSSGGMSLGAYTRARVKAGADSSSLHTEGLGWLPTAGNLITILCFTLCVALDSAWFDGGDFIIMPLSSLLLLLSPDPVLLPGLVPRRRYLPPVLAAVGFLAVAAGREIMVLAASHPEALGRSPLMVAAIELACLCMAIPNHALFLTYLWYMSLQSFTMLLFTAPLNLLAIAFTTIGKIRLLAGLGIVSAMIQWLVMGRNRRTGMRMI